MVLARSTTPPPPRPQPLGVRILLSLAESVAVAVGVALMVGVGAGITIYLVQSNAKVQWVSVPDTTVEVTTVLGPSSAEQVDR